MDFDEDIGERMYKVAVTEPRSGSYFIIMTKMREGCVTEIEFGTKNKDGTPGDRYRFDRDVPATCHEADRTIGKLMHGLSSFPWWLRWWGKERWTLWDFTPWSTLTLQLSHARDEGWQLVDEGEDGGDDQLYS